MGPPSLPPPGARPMYSPQQQQYMNQVAPPNMGPSANQAINRNLPPQIQSPVNRMAPPQAPIAGNYPISNVPSQSSGQPMQQMSNRPIGNVGSSIGPSSNAAPSPINPNQSQQQSLKRPAPSQQAMPSPMQPSSKQQQQQQMSSASMGGHSTSQQQSSSKSNKKKKLADKILPQKVRDLVPESQAYMDLLAFERKLDFTITRKRLDIQEAIKRPMKLKRKLRIFITNTFKSAMNGAVENSNESPNTNEVPSWELRVEGKLLDDQNASKPEQKGKRKFSSFFKSLVIELDKDLYGPDNHLVEWHRMPGTQETDGFQVKRPGDKNVKCTILLLLDYSPLQFKLDARLARLLGIHTQTRPMIINALWQYIKTHKLQDAHEREFINCDAYLKQIFECDRMRFGEIPARLTPLLSTPDPIVINHLITVESGSEQKKTCYDIEVEVDDQLKQQMSNFVLSAANQQDIQSLDNKIHETVDMINELKTNREFLLSFANDPQKFIQKWLISQMRDLKVITDQVGNPEEERKSDFFYQAWTQEAVCRYFYGKVQQKRAELEQALGIRNT